MLPSQMFRTAVAAGVVLSMSVASAQYRCDSCGPVTTSMASSCVPIQPVQTTCYQQVPVTTYRQEEQKVREPFYKTSYVDREVTVMKPMTTQRTVEVPTVSYRTVTESRTVNRDMGRWVTRYTPAKKSSPCQVDARPGVIGWLNRTGYSFRSAFKPNYYTARQYVPKMMACTVPVSRQVAVRGTKRMTYNETKMVAHKETERVAVQKLQYRERVVKVMRPQTAYRTVPIGSQLAYGYGGYGTSGMTAFAPTIIDSRSARLNPEPDDIGSRTQSAQRDDKKDLFSDDGEPAEEDGHFHRSSHTHEHEMEPLDQLDDFPSSTSRGNRRSRKLVVPAKYSRPATTKTGGWSRTSRKTALRSSSRSSATVSQVTLTQKSEN
jgi:hypothetical protein